MLYHKDILFYVLFYNINEVHRTCCFSNAMFIQYSNSEIVNSIILRKHVYIAKKLTFKNVIAIV